MQRYEIRLLEEIDDDIDQLMAFYNETAGIESAYVLKGQCKRH